MIASVVISALTASVLVNAAPLAARDTPSTYAEGYLESYDTYHTRYLALGCQNSHGTTFFDDCCHPLLATETLAANRKAYCTPNSTEVSSAAAYTETATASASADAAAATEYEAASSTVASIISSAQENYAKHKATSSASPSPSAEATTTSTSEAAAATSESSSSSSSGSYSQTGGYATYFYQGGNAGACGTVHSDYDKVIAIDANGWWPNYNSGTSQYCGKWINIKNTNNGKTVTAMVADVCPTCANDNSLDLSVGAFTAIASEGDGMVPIEWSWA